MAENSQTFRTTLFAAGGNNVGIVVPDDVVAAFDRGKRVPVVVTIDGGYQYRNTIASMGGQSLLSFNAARAATGRGAGDEVEVRLDVDDAPRVVDVPDDLAAELDADDAAKAAWSKLELQPPASARRLDHRGQGRGDPYRSRRQGDGRTARVVTVVNRGAEP